MLTLFNLKTKSAFYQDIHTILKDFEYLNNICLQNDIQLFNVSANSILNQISNFKKEDPNNIDY